MIDFFNKNNISSKRHVTIKGLYELFFAISLRLKRRKEKACFFYKHKFICRNVIIIRKLPSELSCLTDISSLQQNTRKHKSQTAVGHLLSPPLYETTRVSIIHKCKTYLIQAKIRNVFNNRLHRSIQQ